MENHEIDRTVVNSIKHSTKRVALRRVAIDRISRKSKRFLVVGQMFYKRSIS